MVMLNIYVKSAVGRDTLVDALVDETSVVEIILVESS